VDIWQALRNRAGKKADAIGETASLNIAYLLEQNRKFRFYVEQKVAELEARVSAQQARLAASPGMEITEEWDTAPEAPAIEEATDSMEDVPTWGEWPEEEPTPEPPAEVEAEEGDTPPPDWQMMLIGDGDEEETTSLGVEPELKEEDAASSRPLMTHDGGAILMPTDGEEKAAEEPVSAWMATGGDGEEGVPISEFSLEEVAETEEALLSNWAREEGGAPPAEPEIVLDGEEADAAEEEDTAWEVPLNVGRTEEWA
jgi:hypothetical protein